MARTINHIYDEYQITPSLRTHQLRVAGVGQVIAENFDQKLDVDSITTTLLLHDMGNIIKFKLEKFPELLGPEGLEYWQKVQVEFKQKYGNDEHVATDTIMQELSVSDRVRELAAGIGFSKISEHTDHQDWERKICAYADRRVTPYGVVSLDERHKNGQERYGYDINDFARVAMNQISTMEKDIFSHCDITPESITNTVVEPYFSSFLEKEL